MSSIFLNQYPNLLVSFTNFQNCSVNMHTYWTFSKYTYILGSIYTYWISICTLIRYSWIVWKIFVNRNNIHQINIIANRNNIHEKKLWRIGIGINSRPKHQRIDLWQIYSRTNCKLFANRELFAEHWENTFYVFVCVERLRKYDKKI